MLDASHALSHAAHVAMDNDWPYKWSKDGLLLSLKLPGSYGVYKGSCTVSPQQDLLLIEVLYGFELPRNMLLLEATRTFQQINDTMHKMYADTRAYFLHLILGRISFSLELVEPQSLDEEKIECCLHFALHECDTAFPLFEMLSRGCVPTGPQVDLAFKVYPDYPRAH